MLFYTVMRATATCSFASKSPPHLINGDTLETILPILCVSELERCGQGSHPTAKDDNLFSFSTVCHCSCLTPALVAFPQAKLCRPARLPQFAARFDNEIVLEIETQLWFQWPFWETEVL